MRSRSAVLALTASLLLVLWSGCAAGPPANAVLSQAVAPTQSQRPDPNAPYVIPAPPRPAAAPVAPPPAMGASICSPDALSVQEIAGDVHGAFHSIKLGFRNGTGVACRLSGYPLVVLFNAQGHSLGSVAVERTTAAEVRAELGQGAAGSGKPQAKPNRASATQPARSAATANSPAEVVLMPKAVAAFDLVWSAGENCSSVARLLVTAPGTTRTFPVTQPMSVCTGRVQVTPLRLDQADD